MCRLCLDTGVDCTLKSGLVSVGFAPNRGVGTISGTLHSHAVTRRSIAISAAMIIVSVDSRDSFEKLPKIPNILLVNDLVDAANLGSS